MIRRWALRGAQGQVLLQVARRVAPGRYITVGSGQPQIVPASDAHAFAADLAVRRGDLLALELRPGAGVGVVRRAGGATTARVIGALRYALPRPAVPSTGTVLDGDGADIASLPTREVARRVGFLALTWRWRGYRDTILDGGGVGDVVLSLAAVAGLAVALVAFALWRLRADAPKRTMGLSADAGSRREGA